MWIRLGVCSLNIRVKSPLKYEGGGKPEINKQNVPDNTWTGILPSYSAAHDHGQCYPLHYANHFDCLMFISPAN